MFGTLRFDSDTFNEHTKDYDVRRNTHVYLAGGIGHIFFNDRLPSPPSTPATRLVVNIGDHLGSTSVLIDHTTGEVVERATYQAYGAVKSDFRPERWHASREEFKFTGKEEDIEVGLVYFGVRYYHPRLSRWVSPDPLTIHGLRGDLNPYAYVGGRVVSHVDPIGLQDFTAGGTDRMEHPGGLFSVIMPDGHIEIDTVPGGHIGTKQCGSQCRSNGTCPASSISLVETPTPVQTTRYRNIRSLRLFNIMPRRREYLDPGDPDDPASNVDNRFLQTTISCIGVDDRAH